MQQTATEEYISRTDAIRQLSRVCPGRNGGDIDRSTLSRWRNLAGVEATRKFNAEEMGRLIRVAAYRSQGLTYDQISERLGVPIYDRPKAKPQSSEPPTGQDFGGWSYANPYQ